MRAKDIINEREGSRRTDEFETVGRAGKVKMITFIKRNGALHCANYAYLHGVNGTEDLLRMDFARYLVVVKGTNLGGIQQALADHRVVYLRESDLDFLLPSRSLRIELISILHGRRDGGTTALAGDRFEKAQRFSTQHDRHEILGQAFKIARSQWFRGAGYIPLDSIPRVAAAVSVQRRNSKLLVDLGRVDDNRHMLG